MTGGTSAGQGLGTDEGSALMGTPGSRNSPRPGPSGARRRRGKLRKASSPGTPQGRESEILLRFGMRLAGIEIDLPRHLRAAARRALLFEQSCGIAAARALARAEARAVAQENAAAWGARIGTVLIPGRAFRQTAIALTRRWRVRRPLRCPPIRPVFVLIPTPGGC